MKVNLGGTARYDEDGNMIPGRMVDMVVDGSDVFIVSIRSHCRICDQKLTKMRCLLLS